MTHSILDAATAFLKPKAIKTVTILKPWVELTRIQYFAGTMVVFWPFAWGLSMAAYVTYMPLAEFVWKFGAGFFGAFVEIRLQIGCGCIWNDIVDRNLDRQVERTKDRPLASRKISLWGACSFLLFHIIIMLYMIRDVHELGWFIALVTIFPLAGLYPFMKRWINWPQAWLGIAINTGNPMAWACVMNTCSPSTIYLGIGTWSWTLWYDTIYACQDKEDDLKAGIKSTAVFFDSRIKSHLVFFGSLFLLCLFISGLLNGQTRIFFLFSGAGGASHLIWQWISVDINDSQTCWKVFCHNGFYFGAVVESGLLLDYIVKIQ
ncbi:hypothetical protein GYMLUDRAFT_77422 [Collybiopsis luxurians FD-317 M1]|uniref:Para-hydroxybenzoate--polyprenyltransferase n=1 Tax=Collybiopsis luxurians FD-317 M1 TaxID=944289 RepID=A0A0D0C6P0_9AGAR|nr:hypothetical protein GYMLUDRAFT_77422 [Collybiopsis luxurians FD-317 M1]